MFGDQTWIFTVDKRFMEYYNIHDIVWYRIIIVHV